MLDHISTTAFAPPPIAALPEPVGGAAVGSVTMSSIGMFSFGPVTMRVQPTLPSQPNVTASTAFHSTVVKIAAETSTSSVENIPSASLIQKARIEADIAQRLQFLMVEAEIDQVPFSQNSYADFQAFMKEVRPGPRPRLFLNDNGNLRALWRHAQNEQIGLQFLGGGDIQFVIIKQRSGGRRPITVAGTATRESIIAYVKASGAMELLG
jgi:hypothetical protein